MVNKGSYCQSHYALDAECVREYVCKGYKTFHLINALEQWKLFWVISTEDAMCFWEVEQITVRLNLFNVLYQSDLTQKNSRALLNPSSSSWQSLSFCVAPRVHYCVVVMELHD